MIKRAAGARRRRPRWSISRPTSGSRDPAAYARWYGHAHHAPELQKEAVYGLTEFYRDDIKKARLVANPGCYTTCAQLAAPAAPAAKAIDPDEIVIDAKSGMTGAGRAAKEEMLFSEVSEGFHAYGVGHHRHMAELDQEFSKAAGREVIVTFTPHLVPMNRGILSTIYVRGLQKLAARTSRDSFKVLREGAVRARAAVRQDAADPPRARLQHDLHRRRQGPHPGPRHHLSALDNLAKGASGQAVQNMNLMLGFPETTGLEQVALFP